MIIQEHQIATLEKRYRASMINSLAGFRQVVLVATRNGQGKTNLAVFNSLIHLGADPGYYGLMSRPDGDDRHTLKNIRETGSYTCNYISSAYMAQAHQTSARYPADQSEFDACRFTPHYETGIHAPFVGESEVRIGLSFEEEILIKQTQTILLIGKIVFLNLPDSIVENDGYVSLQKAGLILCSGLDAYHTASAPMRFPYAKLDG
jgi:flavin reductase (DIM6/NTAB) family NADH-FMN oxidoreductase RutF